MKNKIHHSPGGKVRLALPGHVQGSAVFGGLCKEYRYRLRRVWDEALPSVLFIMMNPSTAEPRFDDPTVAKCRRYALAWGYGALYVGNTFAYRATDQKRLLEVDDPVGPDNDRHLCGMAREADLVVFAYGKPHKTLRARGPLVAKRILAAADRRAHILRLCADGTPSHPLYLPGHLEAVPWELPE